MVTKFSFFESFYEAAKGLSDADRLAFYDAVCAYAFDEIEPQFDGIMAVVWTLAKPNIDSSVKGQKAGSEGGRGNRKNPSEEKAKGESKPPLSKKKNPPFAKPETNKDMDKDKERDMDKETEGRNSLENSFHSVKAACGAGSGRAAPPASKCPLCDVALFKNTQTGRWTCPHCGDTFTAEKIGVA